MTPSGHDVNPDALRAFLATAPAELQGWASEQLAQLSGVREHPGVAESDQAARDDAVDLDELLPDYERPVSASANSRATPDHPATGAVRRGSRINLVLVVLLMAAVVVIIQQMGAGPTTSTSTMPSDHPSVASSVDPSQIAEMDQAIPVDTEREAQLKATIEADPSNIAARQELGEMYLTAALYQDAITWFQQILDLDPGNLDALLAIGVAQYQTNLYDEAEASWVAASELAPDVAEPWYNLGFLYMAKTPPQTDKATECWNKVLEIAPDSEMASAVRDHQERLNPSPSASSSG